MGLVKRLNSLPQPNHSSSVENPLLGMSQSDLRMVCMRKIESLEHWSRRLLTDTFSEAYGQEYWLAKLDNDVPLVRKKIADQIKRRMDEDSSQYPRWIDAVLLGDIEYFLTRHDLYLKHFNQVFSGFYASEEELRLVFGRIIAIRNKVAHFNPISVHDAERALCYSDDIISCYKDYYVRRGKEKRYNVPFISRAVDSLGNVWMRDSSEYAWRVSPSSGPSALRGCKRFELRSGDAYAIQVETDGAFDPSSYSVTWRAECGKRVREGDGCTAKVVLQNSDVGKWLTIRFRIITRNEWHKYSSSYLDQGDYDDEFAWSSLADILPPVDDSY